MAGDVTASTIATSMDSLVSSVRSTEDLIPDVMSLISVLVLFLLIIAIWNLFAANAGLFRGRLGNLFLKVKIRDGASHQNDKGSEHRLRVVGGRGATILTSTKFARGEKIELDFSDLPNFPNAKTVLPAQVAHTSPVRGSNEFLTEIRFSRATTPVVKSLMQYVTHR